MQGKVVLVLFAEFTVLDLSALKAIVSLFVGFLSRLIILLLRRTTQCAKTWTNVADLGVVVKLCCKSVVVKL